MDGAHKIGQEMKTWDHDHYEPKNFEITILKHIEVLEKKREREKWYNDTKAQAYNDAAHEAVIQKLRDICHE